jgi:hypothetical protein
MSKSIIVPDDFVSPSCEGCGGFVSALLATTKIFCLGCKRIFKVLEDEKESKEFFG